MPTLHANPSINDSTPGEGREGDLEVYGDLATGSGTAMLDDSLQSSEGTQHGLPRRIRLQTQNHHTGHVLPLVVSCQSDAIAGLPDRGYFAYSVIPVATSSAANSLLAPGCRAGPPVPKTPDLWDPTITSLGLT